MSEQNFIKPERVVANKANEIIKNWEKTEIYDILTEYFMRSEKFEARDKDYSLNKGIHCIGGVGSGKTKAFEVFKEILKVQENGFFKMVECRHIVRDYKSQGDLIIDRYGRDSKRAICFDELGLEEQGVRVFGNTTNVMAEILTDRYRLFIDKGIKTYTISNLDMSSLNEVYGERLHDRIGEMSNIIMVDGDSFRKLK
jgi:hypothetical protein